MRPSGRLAHQLRSIQIERNVNRHAEGSVIIRCGDTHVLCTASIEETVPSFLKGKGSGWITAEYGMLPRSTGTRMRREAAQGKQSGRTQEIQRLIGRSLRAAIDLTALGERQIIVDCDVLQADGGTRTASITGAYVAVAEAIQTLLKQERLQQSPLIRQVAAVSVGIYQEHAVLDLDYIEDSACETDMNVVMSHTGEIIEIQGTAEGRPFSRAQLHMMLDLAEGGISELCRLQRQALEALLKL